MLALVILNNSDLTLFAIEKETLGGKFLTVSNTATDSGDNFLVYWISSNNFCANSFEDVTSTFTFFEAFDSLSYFFRYALKII